MFFFQNLIIGCSKKKRENYPKKAFEQRNPDLNLILG